ncbi:hypothetical protein ALC56_09393, partial [Trachymyrmex septentrionalis]
IIKQQNDIQTAAGDRFTNPVVGRIIIKSRSKGIGELMKEETLKKRETWKGLSRNFGLFALEKKEIQMDDRKWWTVSDKGSRRNGTTLGWSAAVAAPEEWTSLFSRLWWKRFSRIAVNR